MKNQNRIILKTFKRRILKLKIKILALCRTSNLNKLINKYKNLNTKKKPWLSQTKHRIFIIILYRLVFNTAFWE